MDDLTQFTMMESRALEAERKVMCLNDSAERMNGNAKKALRLLRDFYVAYHKEEWEEGESANAITTDVRIFLDQAASDGFKEAKVDDGE